MSKVTVKISFDTADPLYQFLAKYGARFGHGGTSIAVRLLLDAALQTRQPPNPFEVVTSQQQSIPKADTDCIDANPRATELPAETSVAIDNRQTLLEAISEFQDSL